MSIDESSGVAAPVEVKLLLDDGSSRDIHSSPNWIVFGALRMRSWQIFPVRPQPTIFGGRGAYLLKINYDLMLEPEVPGPGWFEVGFALSASGAEDTITVIDAIPRHTNEPQEPKSYGVDGFLAFVPGKDVHLPETPPIVHLFGLGGPEVRWRHTASNGNGLRPGSYTSWATLAVPLGCTQLTIDITARFDMMVESEFVRVYSPVTEPTQVVLKLAVPDTPHIGDSRGLVPAERAQHVPRVFISYAHDNSDHCDAVLRLSTFLARDCGLDVHMDRWVVGGRRDWSHWAIEQIRSADFVIVIASPQCKDVGDGPRDNLGNRGMQSELSVLRDRLHSDRGTWLPKLLPVVLPGRSVEEIPLFLQPHAADHYLVTAFTHEGAEDLLRVLTGQPPYVRPTTNPTLVQLPAKPL